MIYACHRVFFFFSLLVYFSWRLITLQFCGGFCHTLTESAMGVHVSLHPQPPSHLPPHPIHLDYPSAPALSVLFHALNLDWPSISHMVICMFKCCSIKSSHPSLLPQSPKSVLYICVSFAVLHIGLLLPFF